MTLITTRSHKYFDYIYNVSKKAVSYVRNFRAWMILASLPGNRYFRRMVGLRIRARAKLYREEFMQLNSLSNCREPDVMSNLRRFEVQNAYVAVTTSLQTYIPMFFLTISFLIFCNLLPSIIFFKYYADLYQSTASFTFWEILVISTITSITVLVSLLIFMLYLKIIATLFAFSGHIAYIFYLSWLSLVVAIAAKIFLYVDSIYLLPLMQIMFSHVFFLLFFSLGLYLYIKRSYLVKKYYDGLIYVELLSILTLLEKKPHKWLDYGYRKELVGNLERIAKVFSSRRVDGILSLDFQVDRWFDKKNSEIALVFRELKKWVLFPNPDTREILTNRIANIFVQVLKGAWNNIDTMEGSTLTRSEIIYGFGSILQLVASVIVPFLLIRPAADALGITGESLNYLKIAVIAWAIYSLLNKIDPQFISKTSTLGEFIPIFKIFERK